MPAPKYTEEQIERCVELRESGLTIPQIVRETGMTLGAAWFHCVRLGAEHPDQHTMPSTCRRPPVYRRGNHTVRAFTEAEDRKILAMSIGGAGVNEIARQLGRKHNSIINRLRTLARKEARKEATMERNCQ